jgi:hypothetical protein
MTPVPVGGIVLMSDIKGARMTKETLTELSGWVSIHRIKIL